MRVIGWRELSQHNTAEDLWIAIEGKAYDVSRWSKQHPGGALVLLHSAGKDASSQFKAYHPPSVHKLLSKYLQGSLDKDKASEITSMVETPHHELIKLSATIKLCILCILLKAAINQYGWVSQYSQYRIILSLLQLLALLAITATGSINSRHQQKPHDRK